MPTAFMSMLPRPCATGLLRPKRLFEVDGTTGGAPSSHCGLEARGGHGLPPVVPSTSNSRLGRKSPVAQGRGSMDMKEIGRASCRERVEISGVAGSLKKKKEQKADGRTGHER